VEPQTRPRRHANAVERDDAEHQCAAGVANAVDDHALAAIADHGIFGFVVFEQPTMIAGDAVFGDRRPKGRGHQQRERKTAYDCEPPDIAKTGKRGCCRHPRQRRFVRAMF
jgi:hypothetical protein